MRRCIDLNTDAAEGFALPPFGLELETLRTLRNRDGDALHPRHDCERHDERLFSIVSSINLACGMHSGDPVLLEETIERACRHGVRMGAHPSYPDVFRFGQRRIDLAPAALEALLSFQIGGLAAVLARHGERIQHVKCHGALYFDVSRDESICRLLLKTMRQIDPDMVLVLPSRSPMVSMLREEGHRVAEEIAIDRGYQATAEMLPRDDAHALITDPGIVAERLLLLVGQQILRTGSVDTPDVRAETVCLHADTPGAAEIGAAIASCLARENIDIRPMGESNVNL